MRVASEKRWTVHGLGCEVKLIHGTHRCGYVAVAPEHPWHGVAYNRPAPVALPRELEGTHVGEDIGIVAAFCWALADDRGEYERAPEFQIAIHGGLTYSCADGERWVFGFDCAHADDTSAEWTLERTTAECERLAEQLSRLMVLA